MIAAVCTAYAAGCLVKSRPIDPPSEHNGLYALAAVALIVLVATLGTWLIDRKS